MQDTTLFPSGRQSGLYPSGGPSNPSPSQLSAPNPASSLSILDSNGNKSVEPYRKDHDEKVRNRFSPAKRRGRDMANYIGELASALPVGSIEREAMERCQMAIWSCRNQLLFHDHPAEGRITMKKMQSCKRDKLCPLCAFARANKYGFAYDKKIREVIARHDGERLRGYFVTLTVKNDCDLEGVYDHLARSVSKFVARYSAARKARAGCVSQRFALSSVMADVIAGVFSFELKRGSGSGLWHPHAHGLLLSTSAIDRLHLSGEWRDITVDSYIVDCQEIDLTNGKALREILKYSLRFKELTLADNYAAATMLAGRRLLRSFGEFYGIKPDPSMDIDDTTVLESPYLELLYKYRKDSYHLTEQCALMPGLRDG